MIVVMKPGTPKEEVQKLKQIIEAKGLQVDEIQGVKNVVMGLVGDVTTIEPKNLLLNEHVENVLPVSEPFKRASRMFHPTDTIVDVNGVQIGGKKLAIIAGPCSIESNEQMECVGNSVKAAGAAMLRGGAFKPRSSPYAFQGLRDTGIDMLVEAGQRTHLPIVTELMSADKLDIFEEHVDLIQIGARNMQNFDLLKAVGRTNIPVLLKRGLSATIEEWIMSAEYILAEGNKNVILCERGIRTFEHYTRNTLDLSAVLAAKKRSHLPVIVDPSHAAGKWWMVESLAKAAIAVGADGLMIEVHNDPDNAWCDGAQSLRPERFDALMEDLKKLAPVVGREI